MNLWSLVNFVLQSFTLYLLLTSVLFIQQYFCLCSYKCCFVCYVMLTFWLYFWNLCSWD